MSREAKEAQLISWMDEAGCFEREEFTSAAGIRGNLKINFPVLLDKNAEAASIMTGSLAEELREAEVLVANGGAVMIASKVAELTGKPIVVIGNAIVRGVKNFRVYDHGLEHLRGDPRVGVVEDVSSTLGTVERMLAQTGLGPLVVKTAVCWRRGTPAPAGMSHNAIEAHNELFNFKNLYEHDLGIPVAGIIERPLPLWIPTGPQVFSYLPEIKAIYDPPIGSCQPHPLTYQ